MCISVSIWRRITRIEDYKKNEDVYDCKEKKCG